MKPKLLKPGSYVQAMGIGPNWVAIIRCGNRQDAESTMVKEKAYDQSTQSLIRWRYKVIEVAAGEKVYSH